MPQEATPFTTDFVGATDPDLTPTPFDSVVETSGNDILYVATGGVSSGPGMRTNLAGTSADSYGIVNKGWSVSPDGRIFRASLDVNFGIMPFIGISGSSVTLMRLTSPGGAVMNIQLLKTSTTVAKFRINTPESGTNQVAANTAIAGSTWYTVMGELDNTEQGNAKVRVYVNGVQDGETTGIATFTRVVERIWLGSITGSGVPIAGTHWFIDNPTFTVIRSTIGAAPAFQPCARMGNTQVGIPGVMF